MKKTWKQLTERRVELMLKLQFEGLSDAEEQELDELEEFIEFYVQCYFEANPIPRDDFDAMLIRNGLN